MPIPPQGLTIGRDPDCTIVIGYDRASRRHAQVSFDGQRYYVIDLESRNGTYLGQTRLAPNTPTPWDLKTPLRIGDIYFNLEIPNYYEQQREEIGAEETVAGYIPEGRQAQKSNLNYIVFAIAGLVLLCGCAGILGAAAYFLLGS
jgi:pSer/pThr/pTyr-binding forkhead associated (FHA) protein